MSGQPEALSRLQKFVGRQSEHAITRSRLESTSRPSATIPLPRMASRITAKASCPTGSLGVLEKDTPELVENRAEQRGRRQRHDPGKHDVACHVPAHGGDLAGGADSDNGAGDGVGRGDGNAEEGR
jgi:hypothetical protein